MLGTLRPTRLSDLEMILEWRNNPEVRSKMYTNHIITWSEHQRWFKKTSKDPTKKHFIYEEGGLPLGVVAFENIDIKNKRASWLFYSGDLSRRGLGRRMEYCALQYAFDNLGLHKLYCEVIAFNTPVLNLHLKFGFIIEGILKDHYFDGQQYHDVYRLALFEEWWNTTKHIIANRLLVDATTSSTNGPAGQD